MLPGFGKEASGSSSEDCLSVSTHGRWLPAELHDLGERARERFDSFYDLIWKPRHHVCLDISHAPTSMPTSFSLSQLSPSAGEHLGTADWLCTGSEGPAVKVGYRFSRTAHCSRQGSCLLPRLISAPFYSQGEAQVGFQL